MNKLTDPKYYAKLREAEKIYHKEYYDENKSSMREQQKGYALTGKGIAVRKKANSKLYKKTRDARLAKSKENWRKSKLAILQGNNL